MTAWLVWRLVKFLGMAWFAGGALAALTAGERSRAVRLAWGWMVPGLVLTWAAGWILVKYTGRSMGEGWISLSMLASALTLHGVFRVVHGDGRRLGGALAGAGLFASVGVMVARNLDPAALAGVTAGVGLLGAVLVGPRTVSPSDPLDADLLHGLFRRLAWVEGASLLIMLLVMMPLRAATGFELDGGTGVIGWAHGVLLLVYLRALGTVSSVLGWSWKTTILGAVSGVLPGGPFLFEKPGASR